MKNFITEEVKEDFLESLKTIVSYPSVLNEGQNGTPFGQAIQDVLEKTLEISRGLGFTTYLDPKGYYGYAALNRIPGLCMLLDFLYNGPASTLLWGQGFLSMAAWVPGARVCAGMPWRPFHPQHPRGVQHWNPPVLIRLRAAGSIDRKP